MPGSSTSLPGGSGPGRGRRVLLWAALGAGAAGILGTAYVLRNRARRDTALVHNRPSLAVLGLRDLDAGLQRRWLATALSELLTAHFNAEGSFRVLSSEAVAQARLDEALGTQETPARERILHLSRGLGSDTVVMGDYQEEGSVLRLRLQALDGRTGRLLAEVQEEGSRSGLPDLAFRVGTRLSAELRHGPQNPPVPGTKPAIPARLEAAQAYAEGLERFRALDAAQAATLFERAVGLEPDHPMPHLALSDAWTQLGYLGRARAEAARALECAGGLPEGERLEVEARFRERSGDPEGAIQRYRQLWTARPDRTELGLRLASALSAAGRAQEAFAVLDRLRGQGFLDPQVDLEEAAAANTVSDYRRQEAAAQRAMARAKDLGMRVILGRAALQHGEACRVLGRPADAEASFRRALEVHESLQDGVGVGRSLNALGRLAYDQGSLSQAQADLERALGIHLSLGDKADAALDLNNLAGILGDQGNLRESKAKYQESLLLHRETGNAWGVATALTNIALEQLDQGELEEARARLGEARRLQQEIGNRRGVAGALGTLGHVARMEGRLDEAEAMYVEALRICREIGERRIEGYLRWGLGELWMVRGELAKARAEHEAALAIRVQLHQRKTQADSRLALAGLDLEEGRPARAERMAREAVEVFQEVRTVDYEALARITWIRAVLDQGRIEEASRAWETTQPLVVRSQHFTVRLLGAELRARLAIRPEMKEQPESLQRARELKSALASAERQSAVLLALRLRLAMADLGLRDRAGPDPYALLAEDAQRLGCGLVARRARARGGPLK